MARWFWTGLFYLLVIEIFSVLPLRPEKLPINSPPFVSGAVHVSVAGRGLTEKGFEKLSEAAVKAGLNFVVVTAPDEKLPSETARTVHGVDIFPEIEVSTPGGHALLFYSHTQAASLPEKRLKDLAWRHYLGEESVAGMFLVVAHPSSVFTPWERLDRFPDGTELVNLRSLVERQAFDNILGFGATLIASPLNPYLAALRLYEPSVRDFRGWDAMNSVSPGHFGVVATDDLSHWPVFSNWGWTFPPWSQTLSVASNIVFPEEPLSDNFDTRRKQIYRSLREGRGALLLQAVHPFEGNDWMLACGKKEYRSGDKFALREPGCEFVVRTPSTLPFRKRLVLLRDGEIVAEVENAKAVERIPVERDGAYRLEVWVRRTTLFRILLNREVPYLMYNPLYVR